jgi:hypothetical protein
MSERPAGPVRASARSLDPLRRVLQAERRPAGERCEMCTAPVSDNHSHVVDLDSRQLMCTCRPCALLFDNAGAGAGRYRLVPERVLSFPSFALTPAQWDDLQVPVGVAFFFRNSALDRTVGFYPSPAGATESELPLAAWDEVVAANPDLATMAPDVEALLVRSSRDTFECYLVPIDRCYELVGHLRLLWRGFDGGKDARERIDAFFADVREHARPAPSAAAGAEGTREP